MNWLSRITGRQHHFKVVVRYTPDPGKGETYVERRGNVWMASRAHIADERAVKKAMTGSMFQTMPRRLKRNGKLEVTEVYYLGWFKPEGRKGK